MSTMTSPLMPVAKISELSSFKEDDKEYQGILAEVILGDSISEYGTLQANFYFELEGRDKPFNQTLFLPPNLFEASYDAHLKELLSKHGEGRKAGLSKEENKARFTSDEWRMLLTEWFDAKPIVKSLLKLSKQETTDLTTLRNIPCTVFIGRDYKDKLRVTRVSRPKN